MSGTASGYPVAPSAAPTSLPSLGTLKNSAATFTLTGVRRVADQLVSVEGALDLGASKILLGWAEPGFEYYKDPATQRDTATFEFSNVTMTVGGDTQVYLPARGPDGRCACARIPTTPAGPFGVYVVLGAPTGATSVTLSIAGLGTLRDVPVSS